MALLEEDENDVSFENSAVITVDNKSFEDQNVYGDKMFPKRRTVIPGSSFRRVYGSDFPDMVRVRWQGKRYPARLSFRSRSGGGSVPVFEFFLDADTRSKLKNK